MFKLVGREALLREREERSRQEQERREEKERRRLEKLRVDAEREAQKRIPPQQMFRMDTDKYSHWDEKVSDGGGERPAGRPSLCVFSSLSGVICVYGAP